MSRMGNASRAADHDPQGASGGLTSALFVVAILYFWIGVLPFPDLGVYNPAGAVESSNLFNQLLIGAISLLTIGVLAQHSAGHLVPKLWGLLGIVFLWLVITALFSSQPAFVLRRLAYAFLTCICAGGVLLLPKSSLSFARLMTACLLLALALCYFGVAALPQRAIHQASDIFEPALAGDWRGYFAHKNTAAAAMVYSTFFGLYIAKRHSAGLGGLIVVLACVFLWKTAGKTSAAMLPCVLMAVWVFERAGPFRLLLVAGGLGVMNFVLMSAAVSPPMQQVLASLGVDPTFTDRAAIWRIALSAIAQSPLTGYGFQSFWDTDAVFGSEAAMSSWAVAAASAHNGYVELALHGGLPLLCLAMIWLMFLPCRHADIALKRDAGSDLTRLFIRIWFFSLFLGCLESIFLNGEQMWFTMLMAVFGLRLQAYANPARIAPTEERTRTSPRPGRFGQRAGAVVGNARMAPFRKGRSEP